VRSQLAVPAVLTGAALVVVADGIADPGNLGTILRSAEAAGVDAVVLTPGTVDALNPKAVRASAGSLFHVPIVAAGLADVGAAGLRRIGTSSHHGIPHDDVDWTGRVAIVLGSEAHGLPADAPVDDWVRIAHAGRAESLNVAMAATVLCFAAAAARR
jgi:TrmH family RNA methyltransferase